MSKILTDEERLQLRKQHRKERDKRRCDRIKAVLAYDKGYTLAQIGDMLLLDMETIRRHIKEYQQEEKLHCDNGGSESFLTEAEKTPLIEHLKEHTYWSVKDIQAYIQVTFGVRYSISGLTKWLRAQGFRYKKPQGVPAKADPEAQEAFIQQYQQIKQTAKRQDEPIYFVDSVHPQHQTQLVAGWIYRGVRKAVPTTGRQCRVHIMGGICLQGHRFLYQQTTTVNGAAIIAFLAKLRAAYPDQRPIHIIWDNAGYHRSHEVKAQAHALGIQLHYLPPYSPNLNPIERVWKVMHQQVRYNRYYPTFQLFTDQILQCLETFTQGSDLLRSRVTDNFQRLALPFTSS